MHKCKSKNVRQAFWCARALGVMAQKKRTLEQRVNEKFNRQGFKTRQ